MSVRRRWRGSSPRIRTSLVVVAVVTATFAAVFVSSSSATLTGSGFNSTNGSLTDTSLHDWNPAGSPTGNIGPFSTITCSSNVNCGLDPDNHSSTDNSLGQGSKEDDVAPTVVSGQIPPSKDDLSRFYVNKTKAGGNDYLFLAWERSNLLGSAHMDFEFNQDSTPSANGVTPVRTLGDLLVDFDFSGSGTPVLAKHTWVSTANPSSVCEASNTSPCWNKATDLTTGGFADGSVNSAPVTDNNAPNNPRTLAGNTKNGVNSTFGEAAINLTASGIFPANQCTHFGSAYLKSRSSGNSFSSELKDFISPIPVNISNCGEIKIIKRTSPRGGNQSFSFTSDLTDPSGTVTTTTSPYCQGDTSPSAFTLNDNGNSTTDSSGNTEDCVNVLAGTYHVSEGAPSGGYVLQSITCSATGTSSGAQDGTDATKADITVNPDETVTCVFLNRLQLGAIKVTKQSAKTGHAKLAGAKIAIKDPGGTALSGSPFTTDSNGVVCVDSLPIGDYKVQETQAPTGYTIDDTTEHTVTVTDTGAKCTDASFTGQTLTFNDSPKTDLAITVTSEDTGSGGSTSTITCTDDSTGPPPTGIGNSPQTGGPASAVEVDANGLKPGDYTCKVHIDP